MTSTTPLRIALRACAASWSLAATVLLAPATWAAPPFTVSADGTVADAATGLMWDRCAWGQTGTNCADGSATPGTWAQALAAAQTANTNGYKGYSDWRLPNRNELESLVKIDGTAAPYIDTTAFPGMPANGNPSVFWSSTNYAPDLALAWYAGFYDGYSYAGDKTSYFSVRLVRSGQSCAFFDALTPPTATPTATLAAAVPGPNGTTANASATVNRAASGWWLVLPAASPAPTAAVIKNTGTATSVLAPNVASPIAISNLTPGTAYKLYFVAESDCGNQSAVQSQPFTTPSLPGAPTGVSANPGAPGSGEVTVSWTAPADNGSAITGYAVAMSPSGTCTPSPATATTCTATSLPNAASYTVTVTAANGVGTGPASAQAGATLQGAQAIDFDNPGAQAFGTAPTLSATGGGSGQPVTFSSSTGGVCTITPAGTLTLASVGPCTITANQAGNALWAAAPPVPRSFAIGQGVNTINFQPQTSPRTYTTGGTFNISPTATATSGLAVAHGSMTPGVCTVLGTTVTMQGAGTCTIEATQGGNANWAAAAPVPQSITIQKGVNTITFGAQPGQTYTTGGTFAIDPQATATSNLAVTYTSTTESVCTVASTTMTIVGAGTCTLAADQAGDANWAAATRVTQNVAIGQGAQTITFADPGAQAVGTPLALSATASSGLAVSFTATGDCSLGGGTVSFASPGTCTVTASQAGDADWAAAADVVHSFAVALRSRSVAVPGGTATASFTGGGAACTFESLAPATPATSGPAQPPAGLVFAHGLLDFVLTGCDQSPVTMTVTYPQALAQGTKYWKLHAGEWGEYAADVDEAAGTVVFTLRDGGAGDDDGVENGRIVDPSGAAHRAASATAAPVPVPALGPWALGLLSLGLGLLGWRRRG